MSVEDVKLFIKTIIESYKDQTCTRFRLNSNDPIRFDSKRHIDIQYISFFVSNKEIKLIFSNGYINIDIESKDYNIAGNTFKDSVEMNKVLSLLETKILLANIKKENQDRLI